MAKGGQFENEVGRELSLLWSDGEDCDLIRRTVSSGGKFTVLNAKSGGTASLFHAGDLTAADPEVIPLFTVMSIECKTGYARKIKAGLTNWAILDAIDGREKVPTFLSMWKQCQRDADESGRVPVLIFRRQQKMICIAMPSHIFHEFVAMAGDSKWNSLRLKSRAFNVDITIMNFKEFIGWIGAAFKAWVMSIYNSKIGKKPARKRGTQ